MGQVTIVLRFSPLPYFENTLRQFIESPLVEKIIIIHNGNLFRSFEKCVGMKALSPFTPKSINKILKIAKTKYLFIIARDSNVQLGSRSIDRFVAVAKLTKAGIVYSNYFETKDGELREHPVNDYQLGSIRDNFDFGPVMFFSVSALRRASKKFRLVSGLEAVGLYDLRLKISCSHDLFHIPEYLYSASEDSEKASAHKQFDYVDPRNWLVQKELESVATEHLRNIGAYLRPKFKRVPKADIKFPVEASIVIPVRNRERMIGEALRSALSQRVDFLYNVIVVDNHSTDKTTQIVSEVARMNSNVVHLIPSRTDLAIGGCWNEAIFSERCGRYAVQLDSDDLYSGPDSLQKIINAFGAKDHAMIIGSYRLVNLDMEEIPPGLIDHKEWTAENGRNNALRINGLGAPRAFDTALLRTIGFPNVSYGEDYAVALALSREYQIGRIYECLYLCRRWEGNSDSALSVVKANGNDFYKDKIRTLEILARQRFNNTRDKGRARGIR